MSPSMLSMTYWISTGLKYGKIGFSFDWMVFELDVMFRSDSIVNTLLL